MNDKQKGWFIEKTGNIAIVLMLTLAFFPLLNLTTAFAYAWFIWNTSLILFILIIVVHLLLPVSWNIAWKKYYSNNDKD